MTRLGIQEGFLVLRASIDINRKTSDLSGIRIVSVIESWFMIHE